MLVVELGAGNGNKLLTDHCSDDLCFGIDFYITDPDLLDEFHHTTKYSRIFPMSGSALQMAPLFQDKTVDVLIISIKDQLTQRSLMKAWKGKLKDGASFRAISSDGGDGSSGSRVYLDVEVDDIKV